MIQYNQLIKTVMDHGQWKEGRNGRTLSYFGYFYKVNLQEGFPLLTTKKMNWKSIVAENIWFLSGDKNITELKKYTSIWNPWADENNKVPSPYGYYWRNFPKPHREFYGPGISKIGTDQISNVVEELKTNPFSRRLVVTAWEPSNAWNSTLPPCHYTFCFNVIRTQGELYLNCHLTQRSGDAIIGIPYNLAGYALITHLIAKEVEMIPGVFAHSIIDAHIYQNQIDAANEVLSREPRELPYLTLPNKSLFDLTYDDISDIKIHNYNPHPPIKAPVSV